ncbi:MAG: hypothetical protein IJR02_00275 [Bacteroidaceae bacterium]|jgi:hypothetical protein|nr:hypothetical protein [Bacteroidaceae bacterium]
MNKNLLKKAYTMPRIHVLGLMAQNQVLVGSEREPGFAVETNLPGLGV